MKKLILFSSLSMLLLFATVAKAQYEDTKVLPLKVAVNAGTNGFGLDLIQPITESIEVRLGGSWIPTFTTKVQSIKVGDFNADANLKAKDFTNIHLLVDVYPIKNSGFRITPGIGYFNSSTVQSTIAPTGSYKLNDLVLTPEVIGSATGSIEWSGAAPYLGAGYEFGRNDSKHLVFGFDLGLYYLPKPKGTIEGVGLLSQNAVNTPIFNENIKGYRYLPSIQLNVIYRF